MANWVYNTSKETQHYVDVLYKEPMPFEELVWSPNLFPRMTGRHCEVNQYEINMCHHLDAIDVWHKGFYCAELMAHELYEQRNEYAGMSAKEARLHQLRKKMDRLIEEYV